MPTGGANLGSPATAVLTITNDDTVSAAGSLQYSASNFVVSEGNSGTANATITVTRTGGSTGAVGISYATQNNTATAGSDYTARAGTLSWASGDSASKSFTVPIQGDTTVEPDELVNLTLASPTGGAVIGSPSTATLTIVNNDGAGAAGTLQFSSATYFQLEGDSGTSLAAITVTRIGGTFGAVGVSYATSNGTATAGSDYTATSGTLSWANGETGTKTFTVTVQGDTTAEPDETVNLTLSSATGGATLGSPANATLTIVLDEAAPANGTLQFSAASYSAAEGNSGSSTATITVTRTGGSAGAVGVSFATGNGTATAGSDYTATNGTLSWADGDTAAKTFAVTVLGDTTVEGDETVNLTLSSPTGGAGLGSPATSVLTITNDDTTPANGTLQFSASFYTKAEGNSGNSTATITVTRTGGSSGAVGVSFATSNGTATAGSDYTATSGTLSWADGDTAAKTFAVTVLGDTTVEGDETVNLTLSSPTGGATLGTPTSATLTITNDDVASETFVNFEAQHTRPVCLSPDGTRLFVVNTPDARLSVFDVSNPANPLPVLIREIRTGIDPVAVNAVSNDEAWVVNELSDSVSIVSVSSGITVATLPCKDEPGDVVFAGGKAFVSCARNNGIRIFSISTLQELAFVTLTSQYPKALAVNAAGDRVYAVSKLSGNRTTLLPANLAPAQPAPTNTALPAAPDAGLIVTADDSRLSPKPNMPDNDVAEINVSTHAVARYFKGVGTINFAAAVRPGASGELWIANTEARNAIRFEPVLKGHSVDNRITMITTGTTPVVTPFDLNPGINYALFPNPGALATAVAQPAALEFEPDGTHLWVASFGTDRLARVNAASGAVVSRVDTGPPATSPNPTREKRGPRGLAWQAATGRLYVVNRLSNTIMVVNGTNGTLLGEMPCGTYDPTPAVIREGRGFLYDAKLSGNGTQSCASCHIDGDRDDIAWDLGDPGGNMDTATSTVPQTGATQTIQLHPMKGPMTTQTLRGIKGTDPLHWRGDRATFNQFNGAFAGLLGGSTLTTADMNAFKAFVETMVYHPNPNLNLDRTLPATFEGANPVAGRNTYINETYTTGLSCNTCHALPTGHSSMIIPATLLQEPQPFKVPQLRNIYQKRGFVRSATTVSLSGFGLTHDGMDPDLFTFLSRPVFGTFAADTTRKQNLAAFVNCLDTGTAPASGYSRTVLASTLTAATADWTMLEGQAAAVPANSDLIVHGLIGTARRSWLYRPATNDYIPDDGSSAPVTRATLQSYISSGATLTIMGVPPGSGSRMALDRDGNGLRDADETLPNPVLLFGPPASLIWPATQWGLVPERSENLQTWDVITSPSTISGDTLTLPVDATGPQGFFRLRRP